MGRLKTYLWRYWRRYLLGGLCLFGTATLVMWIPWWIREAVRILEQGGALSDVTYYAAVIGLAALAQGISARRVYATSWAIAAALAALAGITVAAGPGGLSPSISFIALASRF